MARTNWLSVDMDGLRKLLDRKGKEFAIFELVQNAWDENVTRVTVDFPKPVRGVTTLSVMDDSPEGFRDITDSYTLYAESYKKSDPQKRGAFNAGEKFVLALCSEATIESTSGTVTFNADGRKFNPRAKTATGTRFTGRVRITEEEWRAVCLAVTSLIPPVTTIFNQLEISKRKPLKTFTATLQTVIGNENGELRKSSRKTEVRVYASQGEVPRLYEMGIPVVETDDKWHIDVQQKVPLNMERDNVTPAYLRDVRTAVLNEMADHLDQADTLATWVREAAGSEDVSPVALNQVMDLRFGKDRVTFDPSDPEANKIAVSKGYTVVTPGALNGAEWKNVKSFHLSLPAGQVTPSPKPYGEDGRPLKIVPEERYTPQMKLFVKIVNVVGPILTGRYPIPVQIVNDSQWRFNATYGPVSPLTINVGCLGQGFFGEIQPTRQSWLKYTEKWWRLLFHEFAHHKVSEHLSEDFHDEIANLAAKFSRRVLEEPTLFDKLLADAGIK